jgi:hypothetical protein
MAKVTRSNPDAFKKLAENISQLGNHEGKVGWFNNSRYEDGTPVAYVASIQEFGYKSIPPRLGLRFTMSAKKNQWREKAEKECKALLKGKKNGFDVLTALTENAVGDFVEHISSNPGPKLTDLTLALRYKKDKGIKITGSIVGQTAAELWNSFYGYGKEVKLSSRTQTLNDTGTLIDGLTAKVESV